MAQTGHPAATTECRASTSPATIVAAIRSAAIPPQVAVHYLQFRDGLFVFCLKMADPEEGHDEQQDQCRNAERRLRNADVRPPVELTMKKAKTKPATAKATAMIFSILCALSHHFFVLKYRAMTIALTIVEKASPMLTA
jgi:hypothetical protein